MGTRDLRCANTLYGRLTDDRWLEVKCKRRACGYSKGTVVLHTIDIMTGHVVSTKQFAEPKTKKEQAHADSTQSPSVRAS